MAGNAIVVDEKLAESVRKFPILYDKSSKDFKDKHKKERAWEDVAREVGFPSGKSFRIIFFLRLSLISLVSVLVARLNKLDFTCLMFVELVVLAF